MKRGFLGGLQILRLGLIQACMGAVVVVATSTLNRIMVVELALPALLPGCLVTWHYGIQMLRPRRGYGADKGRRSTPWMMGGMVVLALGGTLAAWSTLLMTHEVIEGTAVAFVAYSLIGLGVSACGTSLLTLLAKALPDEKRAQGATVVWLMMILGFALTAGVVGKLIDPYTPERLLQVSAELSGVVIAITALSLWGLEKNRPENSAAVSSIPPDFSQTFREVWADPKAKTFTVFLFLSMLAYSAQELILEPFAGSVHGMPPGKTSQLSAWQHLGVLMGMLAVAGASARWVRGRLGSVPTWMVGGCLLSALATLGLAASAWVETPSAWPLQANMIFLGVANGAFCIAAIATMMRLAGEGGTGREGTRMGLWGAAQAAAFGLGGLVGTGVSDLAHALFNDAHLASVLVFTFQAGVFLAASRIAQQIRQGDVGHTSPRVGQAVFWKGRASS